MLEQCFSLPTGGTYARGIVEKITYEFRPTKDNGFNRTYHGAFKVCRSKRGHLLLKSYSTIVAVIFNFFNTGYPRYLVSLGYYSPTTQRHIAIFRGYFFRREFFSGEMNYLWKDSQSRFSGAETYVGSKNIFDPASWEPNAVPLMVGPDTFTLGKRTLIAEGGYYVEELDIHGKTVYRSFNDECQRLKRYQKYIQTFDNFKDAKALITEAYLNLSTINRLKKAAA